jgi:hypothetical protein
VPDGVDQAWQTKHYLGAPVPGATMATVNLAHVVTAVEFVVLVPRRKLWVVRGTCTGAAVCDDVAGVGC